MIISFPKKLERYLSSRTKTKMGNIVTDQTSFSDIGTENKFIMKL